jgi:hypothetical protein
VQLLPSQRGQISVALSAPQIILHTQAVLDTATIEGASSRRAICCQQTQAKENEHENENALK